MARLAQLTRLPRRLVDAALLRQAEAVARSYQADQAKQIQSLTLAATRRLAAARELRRAEHAAAAGALYREGGIFAARATLAALTGFVDTEKSDAGFAWQRLAVLANEHSPDASTSPPRSAAPTLDELSPDTSLGRLKALCEKPDSLSLDEMPPAEASTYLTQLDRGLSRLLRRTESRSVRRIRVTRVFRVAALVLGTLLLIGVFFWWLLAPTNVANGKPTLASSYYAGSPGADALVNGDEEYPWGAATASSAGGWFRIDLLDNFQLHRIVVVNRQDRNAHHSSPVAIEISDDGVSFTEVARFSRRAEPGARWTFRLGGREARFVRVLRPGGSTAFALSEIEVYGSRP